MNLPQPMAPAPGHVTEGEASLVQENRDASHAANTRRNYTGGFRRFSAWCQDRGALALPAAPEIVEIYLSLRAESGPHPGHGPRRSSRHLIRPPRA